MVIRRYDSCGVDQTQRTETFNWACMSAVGGALIYSDTCLVISGIQGVSNVRIIDVRVCY
jgi:hypothetical protein